MWRERRESGVGSGSGSGGVTNLLDGVGGGTAVEAKGNNVRDRHGEWW